jgi:hypothetical protein
MIDATGKELQIGDKVVTNQNDIRLVVGIVESFTEGFTAQKVKIRLTSISGEYSDYTCLKFPDQCAKVD